MLEWPSNIPHNEIWIELVIDKGGSATKLLLKFLNLRRTDSVYNTVLIGMLDRHKDTYEHIKDAFGALLQELSRLDQCGCCVNAPWVQRLPSSFVAREGDQFPELLTAVQAVAEKRLQSKARSSGRRLAWEKPELPPEVKRRKASPLLMGPSSDGPIKREVAPLQPVSMPPPPQPPSSHIKQEVAPLRPVSFGQASSPLPAASSPLPPMTTPTATAAAANATPTTAIAPTTAPTTAIAMVCDPDPECDPNDPPTDERPECFACSRPWAQRTSGRYPSTVAGCPCAKREAAATNGAGPVRPILSHESKVPIALQRCTWSGTCSSCCAEGGQAAALGQQWRECPPAQRGLRPRRIKFFFGGDYMSQAAPMGHGGPGSKNFCLLCLARLHETNLAGVCHVCEQPEGHTDPRSEAASDPPARAGSFAYARQAAAYAKALDEHASSGSGRKPEAMDYDSCVNKPLFAFSMMQISRIPLHLLLGIGTQQIQLLEVRLKALDAIWASGRGKELSNPKMEAKLREQEALVLKLASDVKTHLDDAVSLENAMALIEEDDANAVAVLRGKKALSRAAGYKPALHEAAYRKHRLEREASLKSHKAAERSLEVAKKEVQNLYNLEAGPFMRGLYALMDSFNLERQAYHSGALNGNDCKKLFQPHVAVVIASLLAPKVGAELMVEAPSERRSMGVRLELSNAQGVGDQALAGSFERLWIVLGEAASLWTRKEPLCHHERQSFKTLASEFAALYAELFPDQEPSPKMHMLLYHVFPQMEYLGGSGILHEGVVEAFHVIDNRHVARWSNVKDKLLNITLRARAAWQISDPGAQRIRARDQDREERRRERKSLTVRDIRARADKQRLARMALDEELAHEA